MGDAAAVPMPQGTPTLPQDARCPAAGVEGQTPRPPRVLKPKPAGPLEKEVERSCMKLYGVFGGTIWHLSLPRPSGQTPGLPDFLVFVEDADGRMRCAAHEVKRLGGVQSAAQREFEALWESSGGTYLLGGLEAAKGWLKELGRLKEVAP